MKYQIKGIDCAHCAQKIEDGLNKQTFIKEAKLDFINEKLSITYQDQEELNEVIQVINKLEDNVIISPINTNKYTYQLSGVDCASCATKISDKLQDSSFINELNYNFSNQKLIVTYDKKDYHNLVSTIKSIEPDAILSEDISTNFSSKLNYKILSSIIISFIILAFTLIPNISLQLQSILYLLALICAGYDIFIKVIKNLFKGNVFDENFLMGIASIAAFAIGEQLEAVAIVLFYKVGELFQDLAVNNSRSSIANLLDIKAEYAYKQVNDEFIKVSPEQLEVNDIIIIKVGEKVPVDGLIIEGDTFLDTSALTGESKLSHVFPNDKILSGSINTHSVIKVQVLSSYNDSTVAKILDLVENASANKAPLENYISKFAKIYTPIVVLIALLVAFIPPFILNLNDFNYWLYKALIFLVISCPCALVISIPLSFFGGIGNASKNGILIKGANYLEALSNVKTVIFDKTGTLSDASFDVKIIESINPNYSKEDLLEIISYGEYYSNHPLAKAILNNYQGSIDETLLTNYQEKAGFGIKVLYNKKELLVGNASLLESITNFKAVEHHDSIVYVAYDSIYLGYITLGDQIKEGVKESIATLHQQGIKSMVLSGDNVNSVAYLANQLNINDYHASLLPQDKVRLVSEQLKTNTKKEKTIFVGDGINDAPVLSLVDIGVAMGGVGSDAAIQAADIIIMNDDITKINQAIAISKKTKRIAMQNIIIAFSIKLLAIILGLLGLASIWEAVLADVGVALIAIFNAMRILKYRSDINE